MHSTFEREGKMKQAAQRERTVHLGRESWSPKVGTFYYISQKPPVAWNFISMCLRLHLTAVTEGGGSDLGVQETHGNSHAYMSGHRASSA